MLDVQFLRIPAVLRARAISRTQHYVDIRRGLFPKPIRIGNRAVAWEASAVEAVAKARLAGRTNDEIRQLVAKIEAARASADQALRSSTRSAA